MPRPRSSFRSAAVGAAVVLALLGAVPAEAARPRDAAGLRPVKPAWDRASVDDPSRLIVTFRSGATPTARRLAIVRAGTGPIADPGAGTSVAVRAPFDGSAAALASLRADPNVVRVSIDHRRYRDADPTHEPLWHELWGLDNTGQDLYQGVPDTGGLADVDIDGRQALAVTTGNPAVVVAVIDDGVDFSHPDLAGRAWTNPGESGGSKATNGIDDDANGYVDDVHGWDFCHDDNTVHDFGDDYHGTHVAGTIAASLNGVGVVGVAPSVSIMALKFLGDDPACGFDSQAIQAIGYAKSFGVRISNNSWGGRGRPSEAIELRDAIATSGMLFVAAAGNNAANNDAETTPSLPASFDLPNILSVAAIDNSGALAYFSNYGARSVDISAPGVAVLSTLPADADYPDPGWGWLDGTSMAAPHVSATAALVASAAPAIAADTAALKARLLASGKPSPKTAGKTVSGRVVGAYQALDMVPPLARAPTSFAFVVGSTMNRTSASVRVGWPSGTDDRTGVAAYGLEIQTVGGPWLTAAGATPALSALRTLSFATTYNARVRARDGAGNWGPFTSPAQVTPTRYEETSSRVTYGGSWGRLHTTSASGGQTRFASRRGASLRFAFTGRAFAIIAPKGPTRGSVKLYVDGAYVSTVSLYRTHSAPRIVVAARSWTTSAPHTVRLVVVGTARHPRVDIDALAILH